MAQKIKTKQISSGTEVSGKTIVSDGSGATIFKFPQIEKGFVFPTSPMDGDQFYYITDKTLYKYDLSRTKWLSVSTKLLIAGKGSIGKNVSGYLGVSDAVHSSADGFKMIKNGTIISASIDNSTILTSSRTTEIRINNSNTNKIALTILAGNKSTYASNFNLNFNAEDLIQCITLLNNADIMNNITLIMEIAYRP